MGEKPKLEKKDHEKKRRLLSLLSIPVAIALILWITLPPSSAYAGAPLSEKTNVSITINGTYPRPLSPNDPVDNYTIHLKVNSPYALESLHILIATFGHAVFTYSSPVVKAPLKLKTQSILPNYAPLNYLNAWLSYAVHGKIKVTEHNKYGNSYWSGWRSTIVHWKICLYVEYKGQKYKIDGRTYWDAGPQASGSTNFLYEQGQGIEGNVIWKILHDHGAISGAKVYVILTGQILDLYASPYGMPLSYSGTAEKHFYFPVCYYASLPQITIKIPALMGPYDVLVATNMALYEVNF